MIMSLVVVSLKDFSVNLVGKIFNRSLLTILRYYKNKRPPPVSGQPFDAAVSIWFTHNKNLLHGGHFTIGGLMNERYER